MKKLDRTHVIENEGASISVCCVNGGNAIKYYTEENGVWNAYPERDIIRRLKAIGIDQQREIDQAILRIQRTSLVTYAGRIAGIESGVYMMGNSENVAANTTILNTVTSELIEGDCGDCPATMGFLKHALGHTPDQLETFLLNIQHCRDKIRKSFPWMGHFNILVGNVSVGKSLVQLQIYNHAFNGQSIDCWEMIAKGKVFNKQGMGCCNWYTEDKVLDKRAVGRDALTENVKRIASTYTESLEAKHQDAFTVSLNRFGSISANKTAKAINSLPIIEKKSTDDKINLFFFADSLYIPDVDLKLHSADEFINDLFAKERKAFHHLIDNYKKPIHLCSEGGRYTVKAFQHTEVMEILDESDPKSMLHNLLCIDDVYDALFQIKPLWHSDDKKVVENTEVMLAGIELETLIKEKARDAYEIFKKNADCVQTKAIGYTLRQLRDKLGYVDGKEVLRTKPTNSGNKWVIQHTIREDYKEFISKAEYDEQQAKLMADEVL